MPLDRVPDMMTRPTEINDPKVLVQRVLYRVGRIALMFHDDDKSPIEERKRSLSTMIGFNRADLHRLEELLEV
jgi:hypothetical protein